MISVEQRYAWLASLGGHINWNALTTEQLQVIITSPEEAERAGEVVTTLIQHGFRLQAQDYFRETGEFTCQIPALARPTLAHLQAMFPWVKSIERDVSPTVATTLRLGTVLRQDEPSINGAEYERRAGPLAGLYGYQQLTWLVDHQDEHPAFKALLGKIYIDGFGLIVVDARGRRRILYLSTDGERWRLVWRWISNGLDQFGRLALSSK